jgi:hypothetical protein
VVKDPGDLFHISRECSPQTRRVPLYFLKASPGVGKTRLFDELMLKQNEDIPDELRDFASNIVSFWSLSTDALGRQYCRS